MRTLRGVFDGKYITKDIPDEDIDKVMEAYEAIKEKLEEI